MNRHKLLCRVAGCAVVALALSVPAAASAQSSTNTYTQTPSPPTTSTSSTPTRTPSSTNTSSTPSTPTPTGTTQTSTPRVETAPTHLAFTGFDPLVPGAIGAALMGLGLVVLVRRRTTRERTSASA
jgi:hypothetical protein